MSLEKRLRPALEAIADAHERRLRALGANAFGWVGALESGVAGNTAVALEDRGVIELREGKAGAPYKRLIYRPTLAGYAELGRDVPERMPTRAER